MLARQKLRRSSRLSFKPGISETLHFGDHVRRGEFLLDGSQQVQKLLLVVSSQ